MGTVQELARSHATEALEKLADIMRNSQSDSAKVAAAKELLDRGWGKPPQFSAQTQGEFRRAIDMTDDELIAIATGAADPEGQAVSSGHSAGSDEDPGKLH